jgi:hypothetical protein
VTVTGVIAAEDVCPSVNELGLAEMEKLGCPVIETATMTEWDNDPLVPVTLTL